MSQEMPPSSEKISKKRSCLWTGVKLGLLGFGVLIFSIAVFHRPILRWGLDRGGRYFANRMGLEVDWKVGGDMTSGLDLSEVKILGQQGVVRRLEWQDFSVSYDVMAYRQKGLSALLGEVRLHDAEIDLDLQSRSEKDIKPKDPSKKKGNGLPDIWARKLDLQRINVRLRSKGGDIVLRGLTVRLSPEEVGEFKVEELIVPSAKLHLKQVVAETELKDRTLILTNVQVRPGVSIQRLVTDLHGLRQNQLPFGVELNSGEGSLIAAGEIWLGERFGLQANLALQGIRESDVALWTKLPNGLKWKADHAALQVKGYPAEPNALDFSLWLLGSDIEVASQRVDVLGLHAESHDGKMNVNRLIAEITGNHLKANGELNWPQKWAEMKRVDAKVFWDAVIPDIASLRDGLKVDGTLLGSGAVTLAKGKLKQAEADVQAGPLQLPQLPLSLLKSKLRTEGDKLLIEEAKWWVDERNHVNLSGWLELSGEQRGEVTWNLNLPEAGRFVPVEVWQRAHSPMTVSISGAGKARFVIPALQAKDWSKMQGEALLELDELQWSEARMKRLQLSLSAENGHLHLHSLKAELDEQNHFEASGQSSLDSQGEFQATLSANVSQLKQLNGWAKIAKPSGIEFESGRFDLEWQVAGNRNLQDPDKRLHLRGGGRIDLQEAKLVGRDEAITLQVEASHEDWEADVKKLFAKAGSLEAKGAFHLSKSELKVPALTLHSGNLKLLDLVAQVPLEIRGDNASQLPLRMDETWNVRLQLAQLKMEEVLQQIGKQAPISGMVDGSLEITGTPTNPEMKLDLQVAEASAEVVKDKLAPGKFNLNAQWIENQLELNVVLDQSPLQPLSLKLGMPLQMAAILRDPKSILDTPLQGRLVLPSSDISVARKFAPMLTALDGTVKTEVQIQGILRDPQWDGELKLDVNHLALKDTPMDFKEVRAYLEFDQRLIKLQDISATIAGGSVRVGGQVNLQNLKDPEFEVILKADEALLMRDEAMSLRTDGNLRCQGSLSKAVVAGNLELVRGRVFKEVEFLPLSLPNQLPPPPPAVKRSSQKLELPAMLHDWTFDVAVRTRDPIRLLGNVLNGGVVVDMNARGSGAAPEISGKVSLHEARLRLPFSRLNITKGVVTFEKEHPFDPQLELTGDSFINNYQVTLHAYGPALEPKLRFISSPPLSEGEIATLLATGATSGDLRSSEGLAANRAAFLLISQTYRKMFRKAAPRRYDEEPPRLSFNFSPLSTGGSKRSVSATYEISPKLQAVGIISESGSFRGLLYYLVRFQ